MSEQYTNGLMGMFDSHSTHTTYSVSPPRAARDFALAPSHDPRVATTRHVFTTPVVREVSRPAPEPLAFAATW
jgi:hypothetical protein